MYNNIGLLKTVVVPFAKEVVPIKSEIQPARKALVSLGKYPISFKWRIKCLIRTSGSLSLKLCRKIRCKKWYTRFQTMHRELTRRLISIRTLTYKTHHPPFSQQGMMPLSTKIVCFHRVEVNTRWIKPYTDLHKTPVTHQATQATRIVSQTNNTLSRQTLYNPALLTKIMISRTRSST